MATKYRVLIPLIALAAFVTSCTSEKEFAGKSTPKGTRAYVEATIGNVVNAETRVSRNPYDNWSVYTFGTGDVAGMYTLKGRQNPDDPEDFSFPVMNGMMYYEGQTGSYYRFGNSDFVLDPSIVGSTSNSNYSLMYYPYYEDMPDPMDATVQMGLPLRKLDNGVEKCIDFMCTNAYNYIYLSNGVLSPSFKHYFVNLVLQRGEGFDHPQDDRIWVVMKSPFTDIRIKRTTGAFTYNVQYTPGEATEDELMVDVMKLADPESEKSYIVNKYAIWEAWNGNPYSSKTSRYAIIPPSNSVYFILIQDNFGNWQTVTDFYLSAVGVKTGTSGTRYILTIELEGLKVVVRPVALESWDDEIEITDVHKVGIDNYVDYYNWAAYYNAYIESERSSYIEELKDFGDAVKNTETDELSWTFYINSDNVKFPADNVAAFAQIKQLDDVLEGTSTYTNYSISNLRNTMVLKMGPKGAIRALNFKDVYLVQPPADDGEPGEPFAALVGEMEGGTIENCHIVNGVLVGENEVGMIAGSATGGTVKNCVISGNVIGASSAEGEYNGLFGKVEGNVTLTNNKTSGLKFIPN